MTAAREAGPVSRRSGLHVPVLRTDEVWTVSVQGTRRDWDACVPPAEARAFEAMRNGLARMTRLATRGVLRAVVSAYLDSEPWDVRFDRTCPRCGTDHGKPVVLCSPGPVPLRFNCAHTDEYGFLAFSPNREVGVDVESLARGPDLRSAADLAFTERERAHVSALPDAVQDEWLVRAWAMKEAFLKLTGWGLGVEPAEVDVGDVETLPHYAPPGTVSPLNTAGVTFVVLRAPPGMVAVLALTGEPCHVRETTL